MGILPGRSVFGYLNHVIWGYARFVDTDSRRRKPASDSYFKLSTATQSINPGAPGAVLGDLVTACTFKYSPGTHSRNALLLVDLTLESTDSQGNPNTVRLMDEIQVPNVP